MKRDLLLWLDDMRKTPPGWHGVKTSQEAIAVLSDPEVRVVAASLDHDLGACSDCLAGRTPDEWLEDHEYQAMPNCDHFGSGYTVVCWMEENDVWPMIKPVVHSANPVGATRMRRVIDAKWHYESEA